jgi:4-diphosphocytidyl-2C-methyl-D-erythritol kinase
MCCLLQAIESGDAAGIGAAVFNGMTEASARIVPQIDEELALLREAPGCLGAAMAGSGSTVFGVFAGAGEAAAAVDAASGRGLWAKVARPRVAGTRASVKGALA